MANSFLKKKGKRKKLGSDFISFRTESEKIKNKNRKERGEVKKEPAPCEWLHTTCLSNTRKMKTKIMCREFLAVPLLLQYYHEYML